MLIKKGQNSHQTLMTCMFLIKIKAGNIKTKLPFKAITLDFGFIIAESAEIGRLMGLFALSISIMTTCAVSPIFSRTQMNLSDSIVRVENPMLAALMPMF